jgi:hypothetical protein
VFVLNQAHFGSDIDSWRKLMTPSGNLEVPGNAKQTCRRTVGIDTDVAWAVGQTTQQVLDQCGPPTSQDGDNWIYDRSNQGQGIYILHFDDSGELDSIEQQVDQG